MWLQYVCESGGHNHFVAENAEYLIGLGAWTRLGSQGLTSTQIRDGKIVKNESLCANSAKADATALNYIAEGSGCPTV
jgi:hypothetical protein